MRKALQLKFAPAAFPIPTSVYVSSQSKGSLLKRLKFTGPSIPEASIFPSVIFTTVLREGSGREGLLWKHREKTSAFQPSSYAVTFTPIALPTKGVLLEIQSQGWFCLEQHSAWPEWSKAFQPPLIQRRTAIMLPDGRLIPYDYGAENSIDYVLNRVASIHDDATLEVLATFGYLGAAMPAITTLPTPALQRRWRKLPGTPDGESDAGLADGGDPYTGYDCPRSQTRDDLRDGFASNEPLIAAKQRTRLVHDQNNVLIQDNRYDGLTRRTQEITATGTRHFYSNNQWRSVEERLDTATTPERQHIWHPADRWTMIRRDRDTTGNGTLDEVLYCLKDDLDPVAIADHTGNIVERYGFTQNEMRINDLEVIAPLRRKPAP